MTEDLRKYLVLDKHAQDDELIQQASLLHKASEAYEKAIFNRDNMKEILARTDAEIDAFIRGEDEKATEAKIKNKIITDPDHISAFQEYIIAKLEAGKLAALKDAFKERGYMVRELCGLYLSNYFEQDSVRATITTEDAAYKRRRIKLAEGRERKEIENA